MVLAGRMSTVHKPYPDEFRRDVIAVARQGGQTRAQIAASFGIFESCLRRWLKIADREDGLTALTSSEGTAAESGVELRELRKRNKLLEQENEILRRATAYFARDTLPK
jgi:transposase